MLEGLFSVGLTAYQTGMDNVRNLTGSPISGIDPHELVDVRPLLQARARARMVVTVRALHERAVHACWRTCRGATRLNGAQRCCAACLCWQHTHMRTFIP